MAEKLKIIPLGGLNEIGKNMTVYEYGGEIIVVDCGMAFPGDDMYGIDCVIPDVSYLVKNHNRLRGLFITHGHRYGVKSGLGALIAQAVKEDADAVIFGHTHEPLDMTLLPEHTNERFGICLHKPLHVFNPGSLGYRPHSFGTLTIQNGIPLFGHGQLEKNLS